MKRRSDGKIKIFLMIWEGGVTGADSGFFLGGGGAPLKNGVTPDIAKPPVLLEGGIAQPCTLSQDLP